MIKILKDFNLSKLTYYGIGPQAGSLIICRDVEEVLEAITYSKQNNDGSIRIIGLGANAIITNNPFKGTYICLRGEGSGHVVESNTITSFAGETMDSLINYSFLHKLIGLEWAGGLPSTVGGAVRGNAGAFGHEMKDAVTSVEYVDIADQDLTLKHKIIKAHDFSYRNSFFKNNPSLLILSVTISYEVGSEQEIEEARNIYRQNIDYRIDHHPMEYPSCGSVFKNIVDKNQVEKILSVWPDITSKSAEKWHNKVSMGYVVNRLGFSGRKSGGAMVSPKHTNYIVNVGSASAADVISLIDDISKEFNKIFDFYPEPEVMMM